MGHLQRFHIHAICVVGLVWALAAEHGRAQVVASPLQTTTPANGTSGSGTSGNGTSGSGTSSANTNPGAVPFFTVPGMILNGGKSKLTPEQIRTIMMYRALQSRGRGRVQRGVPQFVPFGMPSMYSYPQNAGAPTDPAANSAAQEKKEARKQRLIAARKAAEEKRRAAREARIAEAKAKAAGQRRAGAAAGDDPPGGGN